MSDVRLIDIREEILSDNQELAGKIRRDLGRHGVFMLNLMSSPGAGKTSLILRTLSTLRDRVRIGVIEGDIASSVDAEKVSREGVPAVQLRTGGFCHLDAPMIERALKELDLTDLDCIIIENVGESGLPRRVRHRFPEARHDPERAGRGRQALEIPAHVFRL